MLIVERIESPIYVLHFKSVIDINFE